MPKHKAVCFCILGDRDAHRDGRVWGTRYIHCWRGCWLPNWRSGRRGGTFRALQLQRLATFRSLVIASVLAGQCRLAAAAARDEGQYGSFCCAASCLDCCAGNLPRSRAPQQRSLATTSSPLTLTRDRVSLRVCSPVYTSWFQPWSFSIFGEISLALTHSRTPPARQKHPRVHPCTRSRAHTHTHTHVGRAHSLIHDKAH